MNLYVQWFIIASEDVPNLCIELFINATGIESYFMKASDIELLPSSIDHVGQEPEGSGCSC
uniref:Uncharacterized protein n=1 Tax=Magallana gigas TaxID=29159 RepID=K1QIR6_MAGGI